MRAKSGEVKTLNINKIRPYWRNPRDNTEAIEKVRQSIEAYGYQQLIMVDKANVIIVGHSRYKALQLLGYTDIDVIVADMPEKKAKEYRIIDNKTSEYAEWTEELKLELKEFSDIKMIDSFFPEVDVMGGFSQVDINKTDADDIAKAKEKLDNQYNQEPDPERMVHLTCPHCLENFSMQRSDILHDGRLDKAEAGIYGRKQSE